MSPEEHAELALMALGTTGEEVLANALAMLPEGYECSRFGPVTDVLERAGLRIAIMNQSILYGRPHVAVWLHPPYPHSSSDLYRTVRVPDAVQEAFRLWIEGGSDGLHGMPGSSVDRGEAPAPLAPCPAPAMERQQGP